mmetsp:Transcript_22066/g.42884  ORF Transcript_22066/g.42884 Transcript_22066/m.42884 type:complete len:272 (-) Transcript_22066:652-1467(-)
MSKDALRWTSIARVFSASSRRPGMLLKVLSSSCMVTRRSWRLASSLVILVSRLLIFSSSAFRISSSCASRSAVLWLFSSLRCLYSTSLCRSWNPSLLGTWAVRASCLLTCSMRATMRRSVSLTAALSRLNDSSNFSMNSVISASFSCSFRCFLTSSVSPLPPASSWSSSCCTLTVFLSTTSELRVNVAMCALSSLTCCSSCSRCSASLSTGLLAAASSSRLRLRSCWCWSWRLFMRCLFGSWASDCSNFATWRHRLSYAVSFCSMSASRRE